MGVIVNKFGRMTGWTSLTVNGLGRDIEAFTEFDYGDKRDKENIYGAGDEVIGRGYGNRSGKASITLSFEEQVALQRSLPKGKGFVDIEPFDFLAEYEYQGGYYRDVIKDVEFTGRSVAVKQGDKTIASKFELIISKVLWNQ